MRTLIALVGAVVLAAPALAGPNLIVNGDFEAGNVDFTSGYTYVANQGPTALYGEGDYSVGTNAANYHNLWASYGDHTSGAGNYMIVNGDDNALTNVWSSSAISLTAGVYDFSAWVSDACCNGNFTGVDNAPVLAFTSTDGLSTVVLNTATVPVNNPGTWYQRSGTLTVVADTIGYVSLRNANTAASGNDFGLDDIALVRTGAVPEPASWAMFIGGFGLVGGALRRRQPSVGFA